VKAARASFARCVVWTPMCYRPVEAAGTALALSLPVMAVLTQQHSSQLTPDGLTVHFDPEIAADRGATGEHAYVVRLGAQFGSPVLECSLALL
jgi:hypothetical protein